MALTKASRSMLNTGISDSSDATALTFSSSEDATFAGHIDLADGKKIRWGDSDDYHIHHNANGHTYVAGGSVRHGSNAFRVMNLADTETQIEALADGAVTLYYNGNAKIATANDGIDVTGKIDCTTFESTGAATVGGNLTVTGNLQVDGTTTTINSTTYTVDDLNITLASGAGSSSAADGAGITIDGAAATWNYTHSNTSWVANKNVRAPRFLSTSNSSSNFYAVMGTRSGSGTSNPDIYGSSNTLVLGYSDSGKAVHFNSTGATFTGTISSGAITSTGTLGITGAINSGADTTLATFGRSGSAVSSSIIYADATTDMEFGTTTAHALSLITGDTRRLTIDSSGNATFSAHLIVDGNTTLGNADTDTVTVPGPLAVDTDTLYVDVTNDKIGINVGTSPSNALSVSGVITSGNFSSVGVGGTPGDANTAELGPGYLNLARDDTADAKQILFGKNGAVHSYLETSSGGLNIGGGNVGIGRSPSTGNLLDVAGKGYFGSVGTNEGDTKANMQTNAVLQLKPHDGNSTNMTFAQVNSGAGVGIQVSNGPQTANWDIALNPYGGNVGIGTVDPDAAFHVHASSPQVRLTSSADSGTPLAQIGYASGSGYFLRLGDAANNEDVMIRSYGNTVFNGGYVGIGTSSPGSALVLSGANNLAAQMRLINTAPTPDNDWTIGAYYNDQTLRIRSNDNATTVMTMKDTGQVGVNQGGATGAFSVYGTMAGGDAAGDPDVTKSYGTNITQVNGSCIEIVSSIASSNTTPTCTITWAKGSWAAFSYFFQYSGASYAGGRYGGGYHNNTGGTISGHNESGYGNDYLTISGSGQTLTFAFGFPQGYHPSIYCRFMGGGGMGSILANEFSIAWTT
jgi:hypothetical protein